MELISIKDLYRNREQYLNQESDHWRMAQEQKRFQDFRIPRDQ